MFQRFSVYFDRPESDLDMEFAVELVKFGGGKILDSVDAKATHIVVGSDMARLGEIRGAISR